MIVLYNYFDLCACTFLYSNNNNNNNNCLKSNIQCIEIRVQWTFLYSRPTNDCVV